MTNAQRYEDNVAKVMAHIQAELSNDVDQIVDPVGPEPRFAVLTREDGPLELEVAESPAQVREHYVNLRSSLDVVQSRQIRRIVSEWFVFQQSVATMRTRAGWDGKGGEPHAFPVDTAVLFPIAPEGIRGEIPWNRRSFAEASSTPATHHEPPTQELMETVDRHEAFLAAWRSAEAENVVELLADDCAMAVRSYTDAAGPLCVATGKEAIRGALIEQFDTWRPTTSTILNLIVTDWYIFSNVRWVGELRSPGGTWERHGLSTAMLLPLSSDRHLRALLGYGTPPSPV